MERNDSSERNEAAIMFFTDGKPNRGNYSGKNQNEYITAYAKQKKFNYPIHTYAFGQYKSCSSELMYNVAKSFNGMFGYI